MSRKMRSSGRAAKTGRGAKIKKPTFNKVQLRALLDWFLPADEVLSKIRLHGNTKWRPQPLIWLALLWMWSDSRNLTDAFTQAVEQYQAFSGSLGLATYQGFIRALVTWSPCFIEQLFVILHWRMEEIGGRYWRIHGWVPIAFDGSRASASRTKSNEKSFCAPNYGKGQTARYRKKKTKGMRRKKNERNKAQPQEPQVWITLLWHMGLRLPWMWRLGPSNSSERQHVMDMLQSNLFPKNTLFCGDAGFVGYPLWSMIIGRRADFLIRVGANAQLLAESALYRLRNGGIVLCWPKNAISAKQLPLRLRLIKVRIGKAKVWMLTSVLDPERLTAQQIIQFYKLRWGIELEFRGLKQTLDRAKLRSRNDQRLLVELNWSILAMAVAELLALKEQLSSDPPKQSKNNRPVTPEQRSLANTMRAIRNCLRNLNEVPSDGQDLLTALRTALTDGYQRQLPKAARYRPRNPDKKPLGDPKIRRMTLKQKKKLEQLRGNLAL